MKPYLEVYQDASGEWRWRCIAGNEKIVADSGEGYTREEDAVRAAKMVFGDLYELVIIDER